MCEEKRERESDIKHKANIQKKQQEIINKFSSYRVSLLQYLVIMIVAATIVALAAASVVLSSIVVTATGASDTGSSDARKRKKRGVKPGTKIEAKIDHADWFAICKLYCERHSHMKQCQFLQSDWTGSKFSGTRSQQMSFSRKLREYREGKLENITSKRS